MKQYLELLDDIMKNGVDRQNRTGIATRGVFGRQLRFDMKDGFPLLTTKKMFTRGIIEELLFFLQGRTNIKRLIERDVHIWDDNAYDFYKKTLGGNDLEEDIVSKEEFISIIRNKNEYYLLMDLEGRGGGHLYAIGDIGGASYGGAWRDFDGFDQIENAFDLLKHDPYNRRILVSAWNPKAVAHNEMALPPCHCLFQFFCSPPKEEGGKITLSLSMYQRSCDSFLGLPFNIASYSLLLMMFADALGYEAGEYVHFIGDCHIYENHFDQVKEQMSRTPYKLPKMEIAHKDSIFDYEVEDFKLSEYECHPAIKGEMAV